MFYFVKMTSDMIYKDFEYRAGEGWGRENHTEGGGMEGLEKGVSSGSNTDFLMFEGYGIKL